MGSVQATVRRPRPTSGRRLALLAAASLAAVLTIVLPSSAGGASGGTGELETDTPFDSGGMWIWYVSRSHGGNLGKIAARARRSDIGTVFIKSGDADDTWGQFSPALVSILHRGGLDVCAWQFVYGGQPLAEAKVGAESVRRGADCLVIDAEGHYEGRYAQADRYIRALRRRIGPNFPLALASFPYVDYHPAFPYSVFLGPGGATFNQPQMYWRAIGTSVTEVYEHSYLFNRVYDRPIHPIGQTYQDPTRRELIRFRRLADAYGSSGVSWWSWQETDRDEWKALGIRLAGRITGYAPVKEHPVLKRGSRGDLVVWAQQHLRGADQNVPVTGVFGPKTQAAVRRFQASTGLPANGVLATRTWRELLRFAPERIAWGARAAHARRAGEASLAAAPLSAKMPARRYEINPGPAP